MRWLEPEEIDVLGAPLKESKEQHDPVMQYNSGWYFWDETWSQCCGPYGTETEARAACKEYAESL
jgi:hypothetical protein